ncbi:hypothetical protein GO730_38620 [Spirosoma sp. HMF3257]|uniref:Uncharacterized protein n=1 Tax=Spirosoma telluris TaxID=2183553 RepID=A0A327NFI8_9BACT|nr:hypothetical protein [Spirosoma telluris]RAI73019.1 hypothetical protein HMF3257_38540 [Spirosoma telluris]
MSILTKNARIIRQILLGLLILLPFWGKAQEESTDVLGPGQLQGGMPSDPALQAEIDKVLGMTESKIKQGIVDPGVDLANLMINKALDEMIKAIADAVVLAPAAEKIMSAYQKTKDQRLVKKLASLRSVWKDGQERLNKLNYQDFKLRFEWAKQHNEENKAIQGSLIKGLESQLTKDIWGTQINAIDQTYDNGGPTSKLIKKYLDQGQDDLAFYNLSIINGNLGSTSLIKSRNKFSASKGKPVFLSPYERLKLQQKSLEEAKSRHADLVNYGRRVAASVNYYRIAESEQALRSMLSKRISYPYLNQYTHK